MKKSIKTLLVIALTGLTASCGSSKLPTESQSTNASISTTIYNDITLAALPGDTFLMGDNAGAVDEKPVHPVILSPFEISTTEITNAQYATYLNTVLAAGELHTQNNMAWARGGKYDGQELIFNWGGDYLSPQDSCWIRMDMTRYTAKYTVKPGKENWPVVFVTWYGAKAFAEFYGLDLPTEAQWEYASRAGHQFEFGTPDGAYSTLKANVSRQRSPLNVGSYAYNQFLLCDMVGNVREWCLDWYSDSYYGQSPEADPQGPATPASDGSRVVRGSSFLDNASASRSAARWYRPPGATLENIGFRVVRNRH